MTNVNTFSKEVLLNCSILAYFPCQFWSLNLPEEGVVEEAVKVEAVGGVALEESAQEVAQLGRGSARNPERNGAKCDRHFGRRLCEREHFRSAFHWPL